MGGRPYVTVLGSRLLIVCLRKRTSEVHRALWQCVTKPTRFLQVSPRFLRSVRPWPLERSMYRRGYCVRCGHGGLSVAWLALVACLAKIGAICPGLHALQLLCFWKLLQGLQPSDASEAKWPH